MSNLPTTHAEIKLPAGGTGDPTRGLIVVIDRIVDLIFSGEPAGATLDQHGLPYRGSGVIVALPEFSAPALPLDVFRGMKRESVAWLIGSWVRGRAPEVIGQFLRPRYYGVRVSGDQLQLDVVEAWPQDRMLDAIAAGHKRNQVSVWHAGHGVEIPTGGTGEVVERAPFRESPSTLRQQYAAGKLILDPEGTGPGFYVIHESEPVWGPASAESAAEVAERYRNAHTSVTVAWQDSAE